MTTKRRDISLSHGIYHTVDRDDFCDDDQAIVCLKTPNDRQKPDSLYSADHSEFKPVTVSCRPYNLKHESDTPDWCPLTED